MNENILLCYDFSLYPSKFSSKIRDIHQISHLGSMCQLFIYCATAPNLPFSAPHCDARVGYINISLLPAGMLDFVNRWYWRERARSNRGIDLLSWFWYGFSSFYAMVTSSSGLVLNFS